MQVGMYIDCTSLTIMGKAEKLKFGSSHTETKKGLRRHFLSMSSLWLKSHDLTVNASIAKKEF